MQPPHPQAPPTARRSRYGLGSCAIFGVTLLLWLAGSTLFEPALIGLSPSVERWLGFATLVLPPLVGAALGGLGLRARQGRVWALAGLLLNGALALFFGLVLSFAG